MFAVHTLHANRVMTSGRCNFLSTVRYVSEISKKRCSAVQYGCRTGFHLIESTLLPIVGQHINRSNHTHVIIYLIIYYNYIFNLKK